MGVLIRIGTTLSAALAVAGCDDRSADLSALTKEVKAQRTRIDKLNVENARLRLQLGAEKADVAAMQAVYTSGKDSEPKFGAASNKSEARRKAALPAQMCYKDYCPCDPPQEGMDSILCDQLEAGIDVDTNLLIAGRGGREYRRQAKSFDFAEEPHQ